MKKNSIVYTIIFSTITTFIFVLFLSIANELSKNKIAFNAQLSEKSAFLNAVGFNNIEKSEVIDFFDKNFKTTSSNEIWKANINGKSVIVSKFSGSGLWGTIEGVIAVNDSVDRIIGFEIISHNETPGLGGRIEEEWFLKQLKNEVFSADFKVNVGSGSGDYNSENGSIDGVVGATRTSDSIEIIILKEYKKIKEFVNK